MNKPANDRSSKAAGPIRRLGKYDLIARLGTGGMAEVFLARQRGPMNFEKVVVVKAIHEHLALEREFVDMLLDEARISALIKHPRVIDIYDLGVQDGTYFIAMEYLSGQPVVALLKAGQRGHRLDVHSIAQIIADAADGLHAAHNLHSLSGKSMQLVHRDVTPGNIMVLYNGGVKLVDFGVSKANGRITETGKGQLKGKLGYVSPEQVDDLELDCRSDIFSLGVVAWEFLTYRRLYRADSPAATINMIKKGQVPPPSKYRPDVPGPLDEVVARALATDRDKRYQTAAEMKNDLLKFLRAGDHDRHSSPIAGFMEEVFGQERRAQEELLREAATANQLIDSPSGRIRAFEEDTVEHGSYPVIVPPRRRRLWLVAIGAGALIAVALAGRPEWLDPVPDAPVTAAAAADPPPGPVPDATGTAAAAADPPPGPVLDATGVTATIDPPPGSVLDATGTTAAVDPPPGSVLDATDTTAAVNPPPGHEAAGEAAGFDAEPVAAEPQSSPDAAAPAKAEPTARLVANPAKAEALYRAGTRLYVQGQLDGAMRLFRSAINAAPRFAPAHRGLGLAYARSGAKRKAIRSLQKYLRLAPRASDAASVRAQIMRLKK